MSKSVFSSPKINEPRDREAFDLSHEININGKAGMLLPFYSRLFFAGEKCRLNVGSFFRLAKVNSPAFPAMAMHFDFFKVPCKQLYTNWGAFRENIKDVYSSAPQLSNVVTSLPYFTRKDLLLYRERYGQTNPNVDNSSSWQGMVRLLDLFNYGVLDHNDNLLLPTDINVSTGASSDTAYMNERFSLLPACAYQKVYADHYRNTYYEQSLVSSWNLDNYAQGLHDDNLYSALGSYFRLHYVDCIKDYFRNYYPSLNFSSTQSTGVTWSLPNDFVNLPVRSNSQLGIALNSSGVGASPSSASSDGFSSISVSVQSIRAAFAMDKLLRASAYASQRVVDQYRARFGVTPKNELGYLSTRLGSFKTDIVIGEVTSTSETDLAPLGAVGGKGVGSGAKGGTIDFTADCDCIVLGICYLLPRLSYDAVFTDASLQMLDTFDFPQPELMRLGLRPLYRKNIHRETVTGSGVLSERDNIIVGYTLPDYTHKVAPNVNHGLFKNGRSLSSFVLHGLDYQRNSVSNYVYFKFVPQMLNPIFVNQVTDSQESDQFYGHVTIHNPSVRMFPVFGQPII